MTTRQSGNSRDDKSKSKGRKPATGRGTSTPRPGKPGSSKEHPFKKFSKDDHGAGRSQDSSASSSFGNEDRPFKKPFKKGPSSEGRDSRTGSRGGEPRSFSRERSGDDRPFKRNSSGAGAGGERRSFSKPSGDRPYNKERGGEDRSFKKPYGKDQGERKPYGKPVGDRSFSKEGEDRPFRKPYGKDQAAGGERKPFGRTPGDRPPFGTNRPDHTRPLRARTSANNAYKSQSSNDDSSDINAEYQLDDSYKKKDSSSYSRPYKKELGGDRRNEGGEGKSSESTMRPKKQKSADDHLIRLNRYIANAGVCSRRKADELIEAGVVSVNGEVISELGYKVDPLKDVVRYNGEQLKREKMVYVLLNKPKDFITTTDDPHERKTVMQLVENATRERIYPVGRLDRNTTGLLLMTNDGDLADKLSHPKNNVTKLYNVELSRNLTQGDMNKIVFGLELEDGFIKPDSVSYVSGGTKAEVGIQIHSGKNRIVRRIFESLGYDVVKLDRVVYAGLTKKDLGRGRWRYLEEKEIIQLKHLVKY